MTHYDYYDLLTQKEKSKQNKKIKKNKEIKV